jgi:hypothetical protein
MNALKKSFIASKCGRKNKKAKTFQPFGYDESSIYSPYIVHEFGLTCFIFLYNKAELECDDNIG